MITIRQQYATQQQYEALLRKVRIQTKIITELTEIITELGEISRELVAAHKRNTRIAALETFNDYQEKQRVGGEAR